MRDLEDARAWDGGLAVVARIGARGIAFPAADVSAIRPVPPLWRPPTSPTPVFGFLPLAGSVLPVLNAALLLGLEGADRAGFYAHIVVLPAIGAAGAGLLVDRAEDAILIPPEAVLPLDPADTLNGCATALAETADGQVHILSAGRLLAEAETAQLAALSDDAGRRLAAWASPA